MQGIIIVNSILRAGLIFLALFLAGCGHWGADRYESRVSDHIDDKLQTGMSVAEMQAAFPNAQQIDGSTWLVTAEELCFRCTNSRAFKRSKDYYARIVTFENDSLSAIEAVDMGGAR